MTLSEELQWRGFINQTTFEDLAELDNKKWTFYHGFDASADSQTVGNLAAMMLDKLFMRHGHNAIILAGGATSLIGDPGGKDTERPLQDEATVAHNVEMAQAQLNKIYEGHDYTLVNNLDWTKGMTVIEFLRDIGKHFGISNLIQRDYIATRIGEGGSGISFTELSYTLLQGMDFLHLYDNNQCELQLSGSDQWGNCISGIELIRKSRGADVHALTMPLIINKATGTKFGKSEEGAVWLDPIKTTPTQFYQFWINVDDEGVEGYLKIYTELDKEKIDGIMHQFNQNRSSRAAQKVLAFEVTKLVHGEERAKATRLASEILFGDKSYHNLEPADIELLKKEWGVVEFRPGEPLSSILLKANMAASNTEAKRLLDDGAFYLNGAALQPEHSISKDDLLDGRHAIGRRGKKLPFILEINE